MPGRTLANVPLQTLHMRRLAAQHLHGHFVPWSDLHLPNPVSADDVRTTDPPANLALMREALEFGAQDGTHGWVCSECRSALAHDRVPVSSLCAFDPGLRPDGLPELSIVEQQLLRPAYLMCVVVPIGRDGSGCGLRGNVCAVLKSTPAEILRAILQILPLDLDTLEYSIRVEIVGNVGNAQELASAARALRAFTGSVRKLFAWAQALARWRPDLYAVSTDRYEQRELDARITALIQQGIDVAVERETRGSEEARAGARRRRHTALGGSGCANGASGGPDEVDPPLAVIASLSLPQVGARDQQTAALEDVCQDVKGVEDVVACVAHAAADVVDHATRGGDGSSGAPCVRAAPAVAVSAPTLPETIPPAPAVAVSAAAPRVLGLRLGLGARRPIDEFSPNYFEQARTPTPCMCVIMVARLEATC